MKITMGRIALILALASCLASNVGGQQQNEPQREDLTKSSGWNVGSLSKLKSKSRSPIDDGITRGISVSILVVPEEGILLEDTAYLEVEGQKRSVRPSPMNVRTAVKYDVQGRVFGYVVSGPGVSILPISKDEMRVAALGCLSGFAYYDDDGDGRFETLSSVDMMKTFKLHVPSWVNGLGR